MISKVKPVVNDTGEKQEWFETWFDSPYYHILYKNRDEKEAEIFLDALIKFIKPSPKARILDVACGRGRHSVYLNKMGYDVTGFDLSAESILHDKQFENESLSFFLHDMREVFRVNYFDVVLNLFSSFGYFDKERDNIRCILANATALKPNGIFVFDYFNLNRLKFAQPVISTKTVDGITFHLKKYNDGKFIRKEIRFNNDGKDFEFEEKLLILSREKIEEYLQMGGLDIEQCFGNYNLEDFDVDTSDRLILIARKKIQA